MSKKKERISTDATGIGGLSNPFGNLKIEGLPSGPSAIAATRTESGPPKPSKMGRVVLRRETAHRGGKVVTIIYDFAPNIGTAYIESLGKKLKASCGSGGTVKEREIEIQGEQVSRIRALLEQEGFRVAGVV